MFLQEKLNNLKNGLEANMRRALVSVDSALGGSTDQIRGNDETYRELLVKMQMEEMVSLRNYQKELEEKNNRIRDLEAHLGETSIAPVENRLEEKDDADWIQSWEQKMKQNIQEKVDALAVARENAETSQILTVQMGQLKDHIRRQDEEIKNLKSQSNGQIEAHNKTMASSDTAVDKLAEEYSMLVSEADMLRQGMAELAAQNAAYEATIAEQKARVDSIGVVNEDAESLKLKIKELEDALHAAQLESQQGADEVAQFKAQVVKLEEKVALTESENHQGMMNLEAHKNKVVELESALAAAQAANALSGETNQGKIAELQALLTLEREKVTQASSEVVSYQARVAELEQHASLEQAKSEEDIKAQKLRIEEIESLLDQETKSHEQSKTKLSIRDEDFAKLTHQFDEKNSALVESEKRSSELEIIVTEKENLCSVLQENITQMQSDFSLKEQSMEQQHAKALENANLVHTHAVEELSRKHGEELANAEKRIAASQNRVAEIEASIAVMKAEFENEKSRALEAQLQVLTKEKEDALVELRKSMEAVVEEHKALYKKELLLRRAVHNELMDLKGNIRVFCRVRPVLKVEQESGDQSSMNAVEFPVENELTIYKDENIPNRFEFDSVFTPDTTQDAVFDDVRMLITSVLDGYNVCIFAYGQTGSGKTFTMQGSPENPGVNLRALAKLFELQNDRSGEVEYKLSVSVLEIYNECIFDLLINGQEDREKLDIGINASGQPFVKNLAEVACANMDDIKKIMDDAQTNRSVGGHNMNEHSSRSHLVFTVNVESVNKVTNAKSSGKLNLIDLAGSERVSKTDASGDRLKEAQNINKSLSALGDVIAALGEKKNGAHIPFRNSKLTHLLQSSLGGNSKVAMFVNISPVRWNAPESLCSLNFASRCRKVELGRAKKNGESPELAAYKKMVDDLKFQLAAKTRALDASANAGTAAAAKRAAK